MNSSHKALSLRLLVVLVLTFPLVGFAQYEYEVSNLHPYGKLNPAAPKEVGDYAKLIGTCDCLSISRKPDGSWAEPVEMEWSFKYIMNGTAVQDETLKDDVGHSGSIRLYRADSAQWYVHYYSSSSSSGSLPVWNGGMQEKEIVLYNRQPAPNGSPGYYKIRFYDIADDGFKWLGVWTDLTESMVYETWKIECVKRVK